ncbi:kanadaptin [Sitodiplosis mosellana]|uniref:kanadaptin n=1 Tax=Sitodiplosis mosellana TaxID=263140 RepID=UPI0024443BED|nr:kanadaptin [Sitodiplosis mosellana]
MDNEFKVPFSIEPKSKAVAKKAETIDTVEPKEETATPAVAATEEPESAKVESNPVKTPAPKCPYVEPKWSQAPDSSLTYGFEVLKSGQIVEEIKHLQTKAFWTIGKLPNNGIVMAHPTISRYHAVLQYRPEVVNKANNDSNNSDDDDDGDNLNAMDSTVQKPKIEKGWYLYDLNSTHGSFVNKMKVPPKTYVRLRVGYMLKFGASTRNYILQGPGFDEEAESELTITEMKELKLKKIQEEQQKREEEEKKKEEAGISWGMTEDADEETDLSHNPFASTNNEELFLQDPKKTLRGFFEREGLNLDYKVDEVSNGTYTCRVELPITDSIGRSITAEFTHKGKKKECVLQCALEACRILDRNDLLRQAKHEPRKRKVESSDDDDDEFYDRTTEAEEKRRRKAGSEESVTLSYEQLLEEEKKMQTQLEDTEKRIERYQQMEKASKEKDAMDVDDLDDFMSGLSSEKQMDKADVRKCKFELLRIKADIQKVKKLINIARPIDLPPLKSDVTKSDGLQAKKKFELPLFGKKKTFGFDRLKQQATTTKQKKPSGNKVDEGEKIEEFDEDENDTKPSKQTTKSVCEGAANEIAIAEAPKVATNCDEEIKKSADATTTEESPETKERQIIDEKKLSPSKISSDTDHHKPTPSQPLHCTVERMAKNDPQPPASSTKNRNKNRSRNKARQQIDIDDTEEDTSPQKYSGWVPPSDQKGDGITDLNSKYGY